MNNIKENFMVIPALALYYLITEKLISVNKAEGRSMEPTIKNNGILLVNRSPFRTIQKNDIVISKSPYKPTLDVCKRVIYLQGDFVKEFNLTIPKNHVWLEGDNKNESFDSRHYGPIPIQLVSGRVDKIIFM